MAVAETVVGSGKYTYEAREDWARLPEGWDVPAAAVTVDSQARVYCFNRSKEHPVIVLDREGNYLYSGGPACSRFRTPSGRTRTTTSGRWTASRAR